MLDENDNSPTFVQSQPNVTVPEDAKVRKALQKPNGGIDPLSLLYLFPRNAFFSHKCCLFFGQIAPLLLNVTQVGDRVATVRATDLDSGEFVCMVLDPSHGIVVDKS